MRLGGPGGAGRLPAGHRPGHLGLEQRIDATFELPSSEFNAPDLGPGDKVVLFDNVGADPEFRYTYADYQRSTPLVWLFGLFGVVVIVFGRWQGVRALAGLIRAWRSC